MPDILQSGIPGVYPGEEVNYDWLSENFTPSTFLQSEDEDAVLMLDRDGLEDRARNYMVTVPDFSNNKDLPALVRAATATLQAELRERKNPWLADKWDLARLGHGERTHYAIVPKENTEPVYGYGQNEKEAWEIAYGTSEFGKQDDWSNYEAVPITRAMHDALEEGEAEEIVRPS